MTDLNQSKLINDYVKALARKLAITNKIAAVIPTDLATDLKETEKLLEGMKSELKEILAATNSRRIESATNFLTLKVTSIKPQTRHAVQVNKEL
jgi:methionyl-tRNA synthetase